MREMTVTESKVLNQIKKGSFDEPMTAEHIRNATGLTKRQVEEVIENLRVMFGHPIVAKKFKPNGLYIPRNEDERRAGMLAYNRQIVTMQNISAAIQAVDLEKYWNGDLNG